MKRERIPPPAERGKIMTNVDFTTKLIDRQIEQCLISWRGDKKPKAYEALRRYCQYLAMHGYGANASTILNDLEQMDNDRAAAWIKETYGRFIKDDRSLISHVLNV